MADAAALLEDALPQLLDIIQRLLCVCLLPARSERKDAQENQQTPAEAFHGGSSSANSTTNCP
jgi:hypothetical protein